MTGKPEEANAEATRISKLISRLPELVELERDKAGELQPLRIKPVTIGDLIRDDKLLRSSAAIAGRTEILCLPKRMPVPEGRGIWSA
jgi:hypothetical protein